MTVRRQQRISKLRQQEAANYWRNARDVHPEGVNEPRIESVTLRAASVLHQTRVRSAKVSSMQHKNVWCPSALDDPRDFVTVRYASISRISLDLEGQVCVRVHVCVCAFVQGRFLHRVR